MIVELYQLEQGLACFSVWLNTPISATLMAVAGNRLSLLVRIICGVTSTALFLLARNLNRLAGVSVESLASNCIVAVFRVVIASTELFSKLDRKVSVALADSPSARAFLICAANVLESIFVVYKFHAVAGFLIAMSTTVLFRVFSGALVTLFQFLARIINRINRFSNARRVVVHAFVWQTVATVKTEAIKVEVLSFFDAEVENAHHDRLQLQ